MSTLFANDPIERFDDAHGMQADRGLARQHDRVDLIVYGIGRIADFGPRRAWLGAHRFKDLRGHNHRNASRPRLAGGLLLDAQDSLEGKLQAQVTAGHHHGIADAQNVVELFNCLRTLEFGNQRNVRRAGLAEGLARSLEISGSSARMTVR